MILAHLPSGYVLARLRRAPEGWPMAAALAGSVFPDLDLIWFYLVDDRAVHHHRYWMHAPAFWAVLALVCLPLMARRVPHLFRAAAFIFAAIGLHLILDSLAGSIMWLWPVSTRLYALVEVPATQAHWMLSFLTHWTMLAELAIILWAAALFLTRPKAR